MATTLSQLKKDMSRCVALLQTAESQDDYIAIIEEISHLLYHVDAKEDRQQLHEHAGLVLHKVMQSIGKAAEKAHQKALVQIQHISGEHALAQYKLEESERRITLLQTEVQILRAQQTYSSFPTVDSVSKSTHEKSHGNNTYPLLPTVDSVPKSAHEKSRGNNANACMSRRSKSDTERPQTALNQTQISAIRSPALPNKQINQTSMLLSSEQLSRAPALPYFYGYQDDNKRQIDHPQWDNWYRRFELHFGDRPDAAKLRQLLLHLGGEASEFQSIMLDYETQQSYDAIVEAFTHHYTETKAPFIALREFYELRQGSQDVRSFAQRFQTAYSQASKLNPSAKQTEEQLKSTFVSKVNDELHRILISQHPNYHMEMPLHRIVAELAGIESSALPSDYNKTGEFNGNRMNGYYSPRSGGTQQPNSQRQQMSHMNNTRSDICGLNNQITAKCRSAMSKPKHDSATGNSRGGISRGKGQTRDTHTQYIGPNDNCAQRYSIHDDDTQSAHYIEFDASANAIFCVDNSHQSSDKPALPSVRMNKHGKRSGSTTHQSGNSMEFIEPPNNKQPEPTPGEAPTEDGSRAESRKKRTRGKRKFTNQCREYYQRQRENDMRLGARIARETSTAMYRVMMQRFTRHNFNAHATAASNTDSGKNVINEKVNQ